MKQKYLCLPLTPEVLGGGVTACEAAQRACGARFQGKREDDNGE